MRFIQNLSIRNKLLLISMVPLAALLYFLAENMWSEIKKRNNISQVYDDVLETEGLSDIIHNIQQERGYAVSYLVSAGQEEKSELFSQRIQTDNAITYLYQLLKKQGKTKRFGLLDSIPQIRDAINSFRESPAGISTAFAEIITLLADEINKTNRYVQDPEIKSLFETHSFLSYGKDFFGQIRANVRQAILANGFRGNGFADFSSLKGKYDVNMEKFSKNATGELLALYQRKQSDPAVRFSLAFMDSVYYYGGLSGFRFSTDTWKINIIASLNALKDLEDFSALNIRQIAETKMNAITGSLVRSSIIASLVVLVIALLLLYTIRSIANGVALIKNAADRITRGDVNLSVPVISGDEIGDLATTFNQMVQTSREYAQIAGTIGRGDYSPVIRVRSEMDTLGVALNNMKDNLKKLSRETEIRTWLLTGNSELNDKLRGEKMVGELAQEVISQLTVYLKAQVGVIYLAENNHLALTGSYAFHCRKGNPNVVPFGQGLTGQAALEKKPIIFSGVPDDYVTINSGLGNLPPRHILVYPFLYENEVKGVLEIGSVQEFSELDMQFLNLVTENIGIAFNTSQSRNRLKELLEETQRQAEELEAQQEELRQTNEELQEKTQLLERSEAELKAQQEELQQTNEELEEKAGVLEEQKEKLEIAKMEVETKARELEVTSKYKSEFLANMSHELRTPLNSILILAQLLTENKNRSLTEKDVEFARNIHSSGTDLLNLINEILDLSKVEAGKMEMEINKVSMEGLTGNLFSLFNEVAKAKDIRFSIDWQQEHFTTPLQTDKQRLEQVLRNLLSNAFKFTDRGGNIILNIAAMPPGDNLQNPRLRLQDKVVAFAVSDTGIGIPTGKQGVVFAAFQQADGSTKRKYGGTGLGLSISRELAHALGGEIHLQSEEGKGSVFTLYLPVIYDPALVEAGNKQVAFREPVLEKQVRPANGGNILLLPENTRDDRYIIHDNDKAILIIEDDESFANILLDFARKKGYRGIIAHQGNTGLSLARYYRPDAIILDMKLPVMDGAEVLKQLKNDPDLRHIPVQIISGYDQRKEGLELGAFDFIKKPLTPADMQDIFDRMQHFINNKLKKLLVVEDNQQQNKAIRELIGNGDVKSFSAFTGEEAYNMMQQDNFDCVIIDLGLPDMSGFDLLEKIKENEHLRKIPIVVYTGRDMSREETRRLDKLANTVVLKTSVSKERLLDETILFLHRVEAALPKEKQQIIRKLHRTEEILKNKKVLIVDDDMRNTYSLTNVLEEEDMKCYTAENGQAALSVIKQHPDIDIILMDVMMPEMDGYEATQAIRKMERFSKIPIIALTAKAMKGDREKCLEAGMSDYISKPVDVEKLLSLMRVWLYR